MEKFSLNNLVYTKSFLIFVSHKNTKAMNYDLPNGNKLVVEQDQCDESPRQWCNLAKMIFFGKHSHLGDKHDHKIQASHYNGWRELRRAIELAYDVACIVPVYAYEHSGMTISTEPFSCPWDSGQLGFAIITKKDLRNNYSIKRCTKKYKEYGVDIHIKGEVKTLDQFISGEVYQFQVQNEEGDNLDSCGGFYGDDINENGMLEYLSEENRKFIEESLVVTD